MKQIDESGGLVTTINLETVLLNFMNLSVDTSVRASTKNVDKKPEKSKEMQQSECHLPRVPLRYFPYKVPRRFLLALQRQRLRNSQNASATADSSFSYGNSLLNVRLDGCDFGGQSLTLEPKASAGEQQNKQTVADRLSCSRSSASSAFSSYRIVPLRPRPCWLQHFHSFDCSSTAIGPTDGEENGQSQQTQDLGLAELTDYFQHFVSLCSPKMSDQAQSMYA